MELFETGLRIKQYRKAQKLTQEKLAELIDVSPHYIYEIERGFKTMSLSTLIKLSDVLNISTDYLLFGNVAKDKDCKDKLDTVISEIPVKNRDSIADILTSILSKLK